MKSCFTEKLEDSVLCQTWYKVQICKTSEPTLDLYEETVVSVTLPCPTLFDPMDCSPLGSSVHGISQARILEWVAISYSRGSSWPRDQTHISCIGRRILYHWAAWEVHCTCITVLKAKFEGLSLTFLKCSTSGSHNILGFISHSYNSLDKFTHSFFKNFIGNKTWKFRVLAEGRLIR